MRAGSRSTVAPDLAFSQTGWAKGELGAGSSAEPSEAALGCVLALRHPRLADEAA